MVTSDEIQIEKMKIEAYEKLCDAKRILLSPEYLPHTKTATKIFDQVCQIQSIFPEAVDENELYEYIKLEESLKEKFIQRYFSIANIESKSLFNIKLGGFSSIGHLEKLVGKNNKKVDVIKFNLEQNTLLLSAMSRYMTPEYNDDYIYEGEQICNEKELLAAHRLGFLTTGFRRERIPLCESIRRYSFPKSELKILMEDN